METKTVFRSRKTFLASKANGSLNGDDEEEVGAPTPSPVGLLSGRLGLPKSLAAVSTPIDSNPSKYPMEVYTKVRTVELCCLCFF